MEESLVHSFTTPMGYHVDVFERKKDLYRLDLTLGNQNPSDFFIGIEQGRNSVKAFRYVAAVTPFENEAINMFINWFIIYDSSKPQ